MTKDKATEDMKNLLSEVLRSRFAGELEFGPIVVIPRVDQDGDAYLHAYVVFDGDQDRLDPVWTLQLYSRLWPHSIELGYPGIPMQSFVAKSEWPALAKKLA